MKYELCMYVPYEAMAPPPARMQPVLPEFTFRVTKAPASMQQRVNAALKQALNTEICVCVCARALCMCVHAPACAHDRKVEGSGVKRHWP